MTDKTTPLDFDTWMALYEGLKGTLWEGDDLNEVVYRANPDDHTKLPAAEALKYTYNRAKEWEGPVDPEDAVAAVLGATYDFHSSNEWSPLQVGEMADHFAVYYREIEDPLQDRLDEEYSRMPLEWLGDHGRKELENEVCKDSEIWIDEGTGVWVFNKPGRTP